MITSEFPHQAVVLCGGLGTRLRPYTDSKPKPMVEVNGKPFLYYLLHQLSEQGISSFLLLTGYLGEQIYNYFGNGSRFGWNILYSHGPSEWETGRRLWEAKNLINPNFILLYSDNFVHLNLKKLVNSHDHQNKILTLLLCKKNNGNIKLDDNGNIVSYSKKRDKNDHQYVEVGYMVVNKNKLFNSYKQILGAPDFNLSVLLERVALSGEISGHISHAGYESISDPARLIKTSKFLIPKKYLLIDRDGTINQKASKGEYIENWNNFFWISDTLEALKKLANLGFEFIVITNQAGVARGIMSEQDVIRIHKNMTNELLARGIKIAKVVTCYDHWNDNSFRRKPSPGMFFEIAEEFNLRLDHLLYVGDDIRDCEAAWNAGCGMIYLSENINPPLLENFPNSYYQVRKLTDAVDRIVKIYQNWAEL